MKTALDPKSIILTLLIIIIGVALGSFISSRWIAAPIDNIKPGNYSEYFPDEQTELILLGTNWCAVCAKTRSFLDEENIVYLEYDVDESEEGKALAKKLEQTDVVPVIILRDRLLRGFNPDDLKKLLKHQHANHNPSPVLRAVSQN